MRCKMELREENRGKVEEIANLSKVETYQYVVKWQIINRFNV